MKLSWILTGWIRWDCCTMKKEAWKLLESEEQSLKLSNNPEANENAWLAMEICSFPFLSNFLNSQKWVWKPAQIRAKEIHAYCITKRKFKSDELLISVYTADDSWATCRTVDVCSIPPLISAGLPFLQMEPSAQVSCYQYGIFYPWQQLCHPASTKEGRGGGGGGVTKPAQ